MHEQAVPLRGYISQSRIRVRFDPLVHRRVAKQALVVTVVLAPITIGLMVWLIMDVVDRGGDHQLTIFLGLPLTVLAAVTVMIAIRVVSSGHEHLELHVRDTHALRGRLRRRFRVLVEQGQGATGVMRQQLDGIAVREDVEAMLPLVASEAAARGVQLDNVKGR